MKETAILAALLLGGCASSVPTAQQNAEIINQLEAECIKLGYKKGTGEFETCKGQVAARQDNSVVNANNAIWLGALLGTAAIVSDARLKRDIVHVGEYRGFPLYRFRYVWDDTIHYGVMAQEVQALRPDAVEDFNGYLLVRYDRI